MMPQYLYTLALYLVLSLGLSAQPYFVSGTITDTENEPLVGANVVEKNTVNATVTDLEGRFSLYVSDSTATLLISYVGYTARSVKLDAFTGPAAIRLQEKPVLSEAIISDSVEGRMKKSERADFARPSPSAPPPPMTMMAMETSTVRAKGADYAIHQSAGAGSLTAGEIHDFSKWDLWQDIAAEDLMLWREQWQIYPAQRYAVQLATEQGAAIANCPVRLVDKTGATVWAARTDNTGKAELWADLFTQTSEQQQKLQIVVDHPEASYTLQQAVSFQQRINFITLPLACQENNLVDILFVVDATGSMSDEINYLKAELQDVIQRVQDTLPAADLRLGSLFYRDQGEAYLTKPSPLSGDISQTTSFIAQQGADGGGDTPEAVEVALEEAVNMNWRAAAGARLLFLVLDAPPHRNAKSMAALERTTRRAAELGIRIIPLACSGIDKSAEYLMRALALATNGTYTFLTNDSGIGFSHIEPTTDSYDVEKLNALLVRVIYQYTHMTDCRQQLPIATYQAIDTTSIAAIHAPDGISEPVDMPIRMRFYPNPSSGPVTIESEGVTELFLADISGKLLERFSLNDQRSTIDIGRYPAGTYWLGFHTEEEEWWGEQVVLVR